MYTQAEAIKLGQKALSTQKSLGAMSEMMMKRVEKLPPNDSRHKLIYSILKRFEKQQFDLIEEAKQWHAWSLECTETS